MNGLGQRLGYGPRASIILASLDALKLHRHLAPKTSSFRGELARIAAPQPPILPSSGNAPHLQYLLACARHIAALVDGESS